MGSVLQKIIVFALHGFLGQSTDWDQLKSALPAQYNLIAPSLFLNTDFDLSSFNGLTEQIFNLVPASKEKKIFIGYSLGGRIGLHILERYPNLFDQYIFLSTHPGLESMKEKNERLTSDLVWIEKLKNLSWPDFISNWNSQLIFNHSSELPRIQSEFNREQLACGLSSLSLAVQDNMSGVIQKNKNKIIWVVGAADDKFLKLAETMKQKKILEGYSRIQSRHRILFDADISDLIQIILQRPVL